MLERRPRLERAGADVLLVVHDDPVVVRARMMKGLPMDWTVVVDRSRATYRAWGLGSTSLLKTFLSPRINRAALRVVRSGVPLMRFGSNLRQLGGDFVLDAEGCVRFAHAMRDVADRASAESLVRAAERLRGIEPPDSGAAAGESCRESTCAL